MRPSSIGCTRNSLATAWTLKEWFVKRAEAYLLDDETVQLELPVKRRVKRHGRAS